MSLNLSKKDWKLLIVGALISLAITGIYDFVTDKPDIDVMMPSFPDITGNFPIRLINTGDFELTNIKVRVKSCYDDGGIKLFFPDDMPKSSFYTLDYTDNFTLNMYDRADCRDGKKVDHFYIPMYKDPRTGQIIGKTKEDTIFVCGFCYWNITIESDQLNKSFGREQMYSPIQINVGVYKNTTINYSNLIPLGQIRMSIYDGRMFDILDTPKK